MGSHTRFIIKALVVATLVSIALPAGAEDGRHGGFRGGGDISHFDGHDYAVWRSGGWHHEFHDGRWGWWWVVAGVWYFYPEPIYPYPDPYVPPVVVTQPVVQPGTPPAQFWYFCAATNSYYPYVSSCPGGWRAIQPSAPATAPGAPPYAPVR